MVLGQGLVTAMSRFWWVFVLRGVLSILLGIAAFIWPDFTLLVLVYLFVVPIRGSLGASFVDLVKDLAILAVGLGVYGAMFAFVGAAFKRPLLTGLIFAFGWEQAALAFPGYLKRFTIAYYLQGLVPHAIPTDSILSFVQGIFRESPTLFASLFWLAVIWALFLAFGAWMVGRKEYVLEQ